MRSFSLGWILLTACSGPRPAPTQPPEPELVATAPPEPAPEPAPGAQPVPATAPGEAPEPRPAPAPEPSPEPPPTELPEGAACLTAEECASGVCEGEGCDEASPGICAPAQRACTRDRRPYCGCDDQTFYTSGSCPGQRYAHTGSCPGDEPELPR